MYFSVVVFACILSKIALAMPASPEHSSHHKNSIRTLGATYFITNKQNNTIIVSNIGENGTLSFAAEVPTGGAGGSASGEADALFSQDSVVQDDGLLFAVNAGDSTLSMFKIDHNNPSQLTLVGAPANTMGEFPVAVAFSKKHKTACVANSGGESNIACFKVSSNGLTPLNDTVRTLGITQTDQPTGPANTVSDIIFNQDQSQLLVSVKGTPNGTVGFIENFAVGRNRSFSLAQNATISTPDGGVLPFSMTLVGKSGNVIMNTDAAFGLSVSNFDPKTGEISSSSHVAIANQTATCWSSSSPRTGSFYVTDVGNSNVTEFSIDPTVPSAKIIARHTLGGIGGRIDLNIASTHAGDFLYALGAKAGVVDVLKLKAPGKAKHIQAFDVQSVVPDLPISVQGMAVFVK